MSASPPTASPSLIALDLDGTLFDSAGRPLPSTLAAIHAALRRGTVVALASGRDAWALRLLAQRFGLDPARLVFVGLNGTTIVDGATDALLWSASIDHDVLRRLMEHLRLFEVTPSIPAGELLSVEDAAGFNVAVEASLNGQRVLALERLESVPAPAHKVLVSAPPAVLAAQHGAIVASFAGELDFAFSAPTHLECIPRGVNKGAALRHYCEIAGLDLADTIAFGDHENDIEMLRTAGLGVAMGNALEHVKEVADLVTADNDSDGIAVVLRERFGLF